MTTTHQLSILKHVKEFIVSRITNFQNITLKIHEVQLHEFLNFKIHDNEPHELK